MRLLSLDRTFEKIKFLPEDSQFMQALFVRNDCLDFITELESAFIKISADYCGRQDEIYLASVDDIRFLDFGKRSWPFDSDLRSRVNEQEKDLAKKVSLWAQQAADFEANFLHIQATYERGAQVVIGKLTVEYGVSPRSRKKKP